ncbi:MAG: LytR C-terminal domain-containing protein [Candidatus Amesbacteria bacterium]|nr:LytR C-terminal domain-containing protein [Candidatus Amesbacteria bacterium]
MSNTLAKKNADNVVSVSRKGLALCGPGITGIIKMPFSESVIKDLDVVGFTQLSDLLKNFVDVNKISICELVMVLNSDTYFEKELVGRDDKELAENVQSFVDNVPLANPSSRIFKIGEKYSVVVINRNLYESLRAIFESMGFKVKAVVPELILGNVGVAGSDFDLNACKLILKSKDFILSNSFVGPALAKENDNWINHNKKKALILAITGIAIAISGVGLIIWQTVSSRNQAIAKSKARSAKMAIVEPTPIPTPTPAPVAALINWALYSVEILNGSGVPGEASKIETMIRKAGFTNVTIGNTTKISKSIMIVRPGLPQEVRIKLTEILGPITQIENSGAQFDVLITVGKVAY